MKKQTTTASAKEREIEQLKQGWQRTQADFENYKKRIESEKAIWTEGAKIQVFKELLPILQNINLAVEHAPQKSDAGQWIEGIIHISRQIDLQLNDLGIVKIYPEIGSDFDPRIHEATRTDEVANQKSGTIIKVETTGYKMGEKIITPARVVVQK